MPKKKKHPMHMTDGEALKHLFHPEIVKAVRKHVKGQTKQERFKHRFLTLSSPGELPDRRAGLIRSTISVSRKHPESQENLLRWFLEPARQAEFFPPGRGRCLARA